MVIACQTSAKTTLPVKLEFIFYGSNFYEGRMSGSKIGEWNVVIFTKDVCLVVRLESET
jgi:hypothetical protein